MGLSVQKRVKWSVNERMDHVDIVAEQAGWITRFRNFLFGLVGSAIGTAAGTKGLVLTGFDVKAGAAGHYQITGDGAAMDEDGNLLIKVAGTDFDEAKPDGTYYVHVYYSETDTDNANRKFWDAGGGLETTVAVNTRTQSTYGVFTDPVLQNTKPVTGEKLVAVAKIQFVGGVFTKLQDLRPQRRMLATTPIYVPDQDVVMMAVNIASLSITRDAGGDGSLDVFTATLSDTSKRGSVLVLDTNCEFPGNGSAARVRQFEFSAGAGNRVGTDLLYTSGLNTKTIACNGVMNLASSLLLGAAADISKSGGALAVKTATDHDVDIQRNNVSVMKFLSAYTDCKLRKLSNVADPAADTDADTRGARSAAIAAYRNPPGVYAFSAVDASWIVTADTKARILENRVAVMSGKFTAGVAPNQVVMGTLPAAFSALIQSYVGESKVAAIVGYDSSAAAMKSAYISFGPQNGGTTVIAIHFTDGTPVAQGDYFWLDGVTLMLDTP